MSQVILSKVDLRWNEDVHPHSNLFDDHYYSLVDGLEESRHVFIQGNNLIERWQKLAKQQSFSIMETGFGSGLNFLATWQVWNSLKLNKTNKLHYISIEAFPMNSAQLEKSLANWKSSLSAFTKQLLEKYPPLKSGSHQLLFENDNLVLTLVFADVRKIMPSYESKSDGLVDAWYLDGFAPSKNPEMWQDNLYTEMYRLSKQQATVATYTVAGIVRRGLTRAGFSIGRKKGFGTKREMLTAIKK